MKKKIPDSLLTAAIDVGDASSDVVDFDRVAFIEKLIAEVVSRPTIPNMELTTKCKTDGEWF